MLAHFSQEHTSSRISDSHSLHTRINSSASVCDLVILDTPTLGPIECLKRDPHLTQQVIITIGEP